MTDERSQSSFSDGDLHRRAVTAASSLLQQATGAAAPDLRHIVLARRLSVMALGAGLAVLAGAVLLVTLVASSALPWLVGSVMGAAVVAVVVLGAHAGGHGWFVPFPVLFLAAAWAVTASAGSWSSPLAWVLAALVFVTAAVATAIIVPAVAYRKVAAAPLGGAALVGATGIAVSALAPTGIARVNNETWTAESLSGPLPTGSTVHVAKVEGLRLMVWSEAGTVPGPEDLGSTRQQKEGA